jgi:hypothetical protein
VIDKRLWIVLLCFPAGCLIGGPVAVAQQVVIDREYEYKAAYLYHFAQLCRWPGEQSGPILIGVLGDPRPFGRQLERIKRQSQNLPRRIDIRVFRDIDKYEPCQILFVTGRGGEAQAEQRLQQVLKKTKDQATLIVTEDPDFAEQGAAVSFYVEDNRLKLLINLLAADEAGVVISERLLGLRRVKTLPPRQPGR